MEVFTSQDAAKILWKKFVVVIGDSVQRCVYKDLVCLLIPNSHTTYLTTKELKAKGELVFLGDKLLEGGQLSDVKTGIKYREVRQYDSGTTLLKFYFVTRCYSDHVESLLNELKAIQPHVIIMNSCLWDLHRYGPRGPEEYRNNMGKLMAGLKQVIPNDAVFIWNATLPLGPKCKGGFFLPYFENIPSHEILEANFVACDVVRSNNFIFLNLHSSFMNQLQLRANDGIHWDSTAHRRISNLILYQLCNLWGHAVPCKMLMEPPLPTPLLHSPNQRPLSRSFSLHSNLDKYNPNIHPYEVNSPVFDERYVVDRSMQDHASSYKDRFRLISTPVPSPRNSGHLSGNCSGFASREEIPKPLFSSSPVEPGFKTRSFTGLEMGATSPLVLPLDAAAYDSMPEHRLRQMLLLSQELNRELKKATKTATVMSNSPSKNSSKASSPSKQSRKGPLLPVIAGMLHTLSSSQETVTSSHGKENIDQERVSHPTPAQGTSSVSSIKEVRSPTHKPSTCIQAALPGHSSTSTLSHESINQEQQTASQSVDKSAPKNTTSERGVCESPNSKVTSVRNIDPSNSSKARHPQPIESKVASSSMGGAVKTSDNCAMKTTSSQQSRGVKRKAPESLALTSKVTKVSPKSVVQSSSTTCRPSVPKTSNSVSTSEGRGQKRKASDSPQFPQHTKLAKVGSQVTGGTSSRATVGSQVTGGSRATVGSQVTGGSRATVGSQVTGGSRATVGSQVTGGRATVGSQVTGGTSSRSTVGSQVTGGSRSTVSTTPVNRRTAGSSIPVHNGFKVPSPIVNKPFNNKPTVVSKNHSARSRARHRRSNSMRTTSIPVHSGFPTPMMQQYPMFNTDWATQLTYQMTPAEIAQQQMMVNTTNHRRRSYPPSFIPYMNAWDVYNNVYRGYYHGNQL